MRFQLIYLVYFLCFFAGCGNAGKTQPENTTGDYPYDLNQPDKVLRLSNVLDEISDISFMENGNLACVQDEKGTIYEVDPSDGKIISEKRFAGSGDFEGLAISGNTAFAVTSNGIVYEVKNYAKDKPQAQAYETMLTEASNVEGACYDKKTGMVLLACKGHPGAGLNHKDYKTVYAYNTNTHSLEENPFIQLSLKKVKNLNGKDTGKKSGFGPSGIAIHPQSGNYFIIASVGKLLVELNKKLEIVEIINLPEDIFAQPEGIAFDSNGGMYISNEARGGTPTILYFAQKH